MTLEELHRLSPYSLDKTAKEANMLEGLSALTEHHRQHCPAYGRMLQAMGYREQTAETIAAIPFIPVRMFKEYELLSIPREAVVKTMTSSGTSGQQVSRIFLSKENVRSQTKTLTAIITDYIGKQRLPLLLLDTELVKKDRSMFSARGEMCIRDRRGTEQGGKKH